MAKPRSGLLKGLMLAGILLVAAVAFWGLDLGRLLTLEQLRASRAELTALLDRDPAALIAGYFGIYVLVTALTLPGAAILTLGGGAVFGFWLALLIVSFASTIGATCAFLVSRFLLRDFVEARFGDRLAAIQEGIRREGAFYLFAVRLVPAFPFFLINLVMGLTPIRLRTFYWVSQVGMLAGTAAYVNAGTRLGELESASGLLSWKLLSAFAALGVLPLAAKRAVAYARARKALARFRKPRRLDYNVVVVGAGAAGLVSATIAAAVKARVALVERDKMGGDCLNTGCVPSKALLRSARAVADMRRGRDFGLKESEARFDFAEVMERVQRVIRAVEPHDSVERYSKLGVECVRGDARIASPYEVDVGGRRLTTRAIVVATGARPAVPPIPGLEGISYLTSDTVWNLRQLPRRLAVLGGGAVGCELAQAFARFGSEVELIELESRLLPREDSEASSALEARLTKEGVRVRTSTRARAVETGALVCDSAGREIRIAFDQLLLALGRRPNAQGFGLEELGVEVAKGGNVAHDAFLRTSCPTIYVCGDVAGPYAFTHVAAHQAWYAAVNALFSPWKSCRADYRVIPWATFTDPEVARVGLSEDEAREKGVAFEVTRYRLDDLDRAIADEETHGFVKVLTAPGRDRILGATIVAAHAGELIGEFVSAMKHGIGLNGILGTIHVYPTLSEAARFAAGQWKRAHAPAGALAWVERFHRLRRGGARA